MKKSKRIIFDTLIIIIVLGLFGTAGWLLYKMYFPNNTPIIKMQVFNQEDNSLNWDKLRKTNSEAVGWLQIKGTNIDTPVVQSGDNDKYLYTAFDGSEDERGTPFLDKDYSWDSTSRNAIIYGHSTMRSQVHVMFDDLLVYVDDPSFINEHHIIEYHQPPEKGGSSQWEIVSVIVEESDFDYLQIKFDNEQSFLDYYRNIKAHSILPTGAEIKTGDEVLTLSTCIFNVGLNDGRLAIIARKIN